MAADFVTKKNDRKESLQATLEKNGAAIDLSSNIDTITFYMRKPNTDTLKINSTSVTIVDAAAGKVRYDWADGDLDTVGTFYGSFEIKYTDGKTRTVPNDWYTVIEIIEDLD